MRSLAVRVLNDFGVDGMEPQSLGSRKARLALHLLALAGGQVVSSAALADALWGDTPPAKPDDQLAVLVSRLRSVLGRDRIEHRDHGYLLRCDWLDAAELAGLADEVGRRRDAGHVMGAAAAARVALSLIHGDGPAPLPGEWAQLRRADLERLIRRARQVAATALLAAGDWMAAADAAATALEYDPYDEAALRVLLRAQVMGGRVAAALAAYASTRERLADELGTDPSPETEALQLAILRGELVPAAPAPAPAALGLVGRDEELAYLDAVALRAQGARAHRGAGAQAGASVEVVVIEGEAGIGKTTLLRTWADRRAAAGDTVLMATCGQLDRAMPLDALLTGLAALLRRLGPEVAADLLGGDEPLLGPVLAPGPGPVGRVPDARARPVLTDSMLGPAVLYAALVRVLGQAHRPGAGGGGDRRCASRGPRARGLAPLRAPRGRAAGRGGRRPARRGRAAAGHRGHPRRRPRPRRRRGAGRPGAGGRAVRAIQGAPAVPHRAGPAGRGRDAARVAGRVGVRAVRRAGRRRARCCGPRR